MPTFVEAVVNQARATVCVILAGPETSARLLSGVVGDATGLAGALTGLRRQLCDSDPADDIVPEPPFTGGQCPGTIYQIEWTVNVPGSGPSNQISDRQGPLSLSRAEEPGDSDATCPDGQSFNRYTMLSSGTPLGLGSGCGVTVTNIVTTPLFGGADNCGDPPPPPPGPPGDVIVEGDDITYNIDGDTTVTVPIGFVFAPVYVDLDGSLKIPVNFDVGGVEFSGTLEVAPEFNFEFSPNFGSPGPGQPDDPDGIGEPGDPSTPIDDVEDLESTIVGVLVYSDIDSEASPSGVAFTDGPNLYVPRVASVQFAIKTSNSIGWTPDLDVKNLECYVPCPAPQGAIAVRVSPMPGVQSRFTAVRGKPLTSF